MAQMAPALTEATASPESSRKNSVDRHCTSTVKEELKQENNGLGLDLKLVSHNGLVRLITDNNIADIASTIKPSEQNTPIVSKRIEEIKGKSEMPNGHCEDNAEKVEATKSSYSTAKDEKRNTSLDLSRATCASTAKSSAGSCNTGCENEDRKRVSYHPVASLESSKALIPQRTTKASRRQGKLESRVREVEARLRKLQARQLNDHVLQQLGSLAAKHGESCNSSSAVVELGEISSVGVNPESKSVANNSLELKGDRIDNTAMPGNLASRAKANLSLDSVVKELERISTESSNLDEANVFDDFKHQFDAVNSMESWTSQLELLESIDDSDATEGSSGEESEDEGDTRKSKLRSKRAKMLRRQYHMEEGEVASHWSWLQSQIINLERQIRRYDDLYKGGRLRKGAVRLQACTPKINSQKGANDGVCNSEAAKDLKNASVDMTQSKDGLENVRNNSLKEPDNHLWNGMKRTLLDNSHIGDEDLPLKRYRNALIKNDSTDNKCSTNVPTNTNDVYYQCARTRGVHSVKKRRLVHLSQIRHRPKRGSVCCRCVTPVTPCLMCSKSPRTLPVVSSKQTMAEKVALLDQSFHPVLSFCTDIPLQLHFGALLKRGGFEKRTKPQALRNVQQSVEKTKPPAAAKTGGRRSQLAKGAAASLLSSAKHHNQKHERKRGYSVPSTPKGNARGGDNRVCQTDGPRKKRAAAISAAAQLQKRARSLSLPTVVSSSPPTPTSTPSPTPSFSQSMPPSSLSSLLKKKKGSNAFDINNIVIPYSMASSTRVEKLQYKEIPTPSWRVNDMGEEMEADVQEEKTEKETEDTSDDLYISRHNFCEEHERKRFLGLVKKKRKRATRQSSEISLPDPPSPLGYTPDSQGGTPPGTPTSYMPSPVTSTSISFPLSIIPPPITSSAALPFITATTPTTAAAATPSFGERLHRSLSDSKVIHRRSSSTDRSEKSVTEYEELWPPVPPFPSRTFPLSETDVTSLKLPTPLPTPASSMPASPAASSPGSPMCSPLASPASDASSEKNEWTVKLVTDQGPASGEDTGGPPRKGIVLKLAKR